MPKIVFRLAVGFLPPAGVNQVRHDLAVPHLDLFLTLQIEESDLLIEGP